MNRHDYATIATVVVIVSSMLIGVGAVAGQQAGGNTDWSAPGPFPVEELRQGGTHDPDAPPSARMLGDPVSGSAAFRYTPVSPLKNGKKYLESGMLLESDTVEFYTTAFGSASGNYTLVLVYWNDASERVNGTQVNYAADQTVQRVSLDVPNGYATQNIKLRSHYDSSKQVTAWLERDGEPVSGARWRFQHRSNPLTASPAYPIDSKSDIWRWAAINMFVPAVPGILIGRRSAKHVLSRTIVGPQKGVVWWTIVLGLISLVAVAVGTWQTAAVLARAPYVAGLFVMVFSFFAFLGFRDQEVERAEFNQKDLESVTSVTGEETKQARTEDIRLFDIIRRDGNIYAPQPGLRPFFARYWANPAAVDESDLVTVNNTTGDVQKKYELDPEADEPLVRTPAHMTFNPQLTTDEEPEPVFTPDGPEDSLSGAHNVVNSIAGGFGKLNMAFLGPAVIGAGVAYFAVKAWIGVPSIAAMAALLPAIIAGYTARDGRMDMEEAPYHFSEARAILTQERAKYKEAATFKEVQEKLADFDVDDTERLQEFIETAHDRVTERMQSLQGIDKPDEKGADS